MNGTVRFLNFEQVGQRLLDLASGHQPFSAIRIGDGENSILQYPQYCLERRIQYVFRRAITPRDYVDAEIFFIRDALRRAIENAEVGGLYDSPHHDSLCRIYEEHLAGINFDGIALCHPAYHFFLQERGILDRILSRKERVTLITGRNVIGSLSQKFGNIDFDSLSLPAEVDYRLATDACDQPHFPDRFLEILEGIQPENGRHLFLIGGGFLGKIYADVVRERGGQAIDIGSVFDYWANIPTREGYKTVVDGKVSISRDSFRKASSLEADRLGVEEARVRHAVGFAPQSISWSPDRYLERYETSRLAGMNLFARQACGPVPAYYENVLGAMLTFAGDCRHVDIGCLGPVTVANAIVRGRQLLGYRGQTMAIGEEDEFAQIDAIIVAQPVGDIEAYLARVTASGVFRVFLLDARALLPGSSRAAIEKDWELCDLKLLIDIPGGASAVVLNRRS